MALSTTNREAGPFTGDGVTTVLPFTFKVFGTADVLVRAISATGIVSVVAGVTVTLNANQDVAPGGQATLPSAMLAGSNYYVVSDIAYTQPLTLTSEGKFLPQAVNTAFDRTVALIQQLKAGVGNLLLPSTSLTYRQGKFLGWDASGNAVALSGTGADSALRTDLAGVSGAALVGKTGGGSVQTFITGIGEGVAQRPFRSDFTALTGAAKPVAILSAAGDGGVFVYDADVPATTHQELGRSVRFIAPAIGGTGAWVSEDGRVSARRLGIKPWNTGGANATGWNNWRDLINDMQTRQESRSLTLELDPGFVYKFGGAGQVRNAYIGIDGRGSTIDAEGATFGLDLRPMRLGPNAGQYSANPLLYCSVRDLRIINSAVAGINAGNAPYLTVERVRIEGQATSIGINLLGPITNTIRDVKVYGGQLGIWAEARIVDSVYTKTLLAGHDLLLENIDIQGTSSDACRIHEVQGAILNRVRAQVCGGTTGRAFDIARCLQVVIEKPYLEAVRYGVVLDDTKRVQQVRTSSGTRTNGSAVITGLSGVDGVLYYGMIVTGTGIPADTTIISVDSNSQVTLSANATASGVSTLTFGYDAPYGNYSIVDADLRSTDLGGFASPSIYTLNEHLNIRIRGGRYGGTLDWAGAASTSTGYIEYGTETLAGTAGLPAGVIDHRDRLKDTGFFFGGNKIIGGRGAAVTAPTGGATIDTQSRTAITDLISRLQAHGLIS